MNAMERQDTPTRHFTDSTNERIRAEMKMRRMEHVFDVWDHSTTTEVPRDALKQKLETQLTQLIVGEKVNSEVS